jgi:hypothetical protein
VNWSPPTTLWGSDLNFSSPGNVLKYGDEWIICFQSYPISPGDTWGNENCRLWTSRSRDLCDWSEPQVMNSDGCNMKWASSPRQIDPFIVEHNGEFHCFYKTGGSYGVMVSNDLQNWKERAIERPAFTMKDDGGGMAIENPSIVKDGDDYVLFISLCRKNRGVAFSRSKDLVNWSEPHVLSLPIPDWGRGGITAPMVISSPSSERKWLMFFHADGTDGSHEGAIGVAFSDDLRNWDLN